MENTIDVQTRENEELASAIRELQSFEKKNLRINRIRLAISAACFAILLIAAIFLFAKGGPLIRKADAAADLLTNTGETVQSLVNELAEVDVKGLSSSLSNIVRISEETITEIHEATGGLNTLVQDADEAMQHISSVNYEELNTGIQTLNDVLEPVANFFRIFK